MTDSVSSTVSATALAIRLDRGLTRDEVAAAVRDFGAPDSFTARALRSIETGRRAPNVDEIVWLAAVMRVSVRQLLGEHAALFGGEDKPPDCGAIESSARRAVQDLGHLDGHQLTLAEAAYALARALDEGAGMAAAAVGRELRATLKDIWDGVDDDDDDDEDLGPS